MAQNSQVNVGIKFRSDTKDVENSLSKLKQSLTDISNINITKFSGKEQDLKQIQKTAKQVKNALEQAFNPTLNTINIESFYNSLKKSNITIKQVYTSFSQLGATGEIAFANLTKEIFGTNLKLKQTHSLLDSMGKTMVNTVKWGIASSVMNTFTQSVQGAFQYVQSLEKSLTNIRIVTGDSTEKMAQFAEQANKSAQALGRSTLDYSKASLTFYQQGLNDQDVQARTEATLKAQNITGAGQQMANYLTSVWNGYKVANEEAELYVDKLAAVADSSASDMSQLAIAMSKVASTANTLGVDVDQLNAQIATVVATTRQAPESVGTAFKTIYSRMNDIKTGSDEAEISLGNYSGKMAELGFNVLDATGHLRDTGQVMEEIGGRWQDLTKEQQIYLAQTMGGQRQVNQLMALFDNWTTYSELLNVSLESEGTLVEKNARYMESLGAKMEQLGAAGERVKNALINEDDLKGGVTALTNLINLFGSFIESMGGGTNVLIGFGGLLAQIAAPAIASELNNIAENAKRTKENLNLVAEAANKIKEKGSEWQELDTKTNKRMSSGYLDRANQLNELYQNHGLDEKTFNDQQERSNRILSLQEEALQLEETKKNAEQYYQAFSNGQKIEESSSGGQKRRIELLKEEAKTIEQTTRSLQTINFSNGKDELIKFEKEIDNLIQKFGDNVPESLQNLKSQIESALTTWNTTQGDVNSQEWSQAFFELSDAAQTVSNELNQAAGSIQNYSQNANNLIVINDELNKTLEDFNNINESAIRKASYQSLVKMAGGFAQVISGVNGLVNITKIWNNENLSMGEKIQQITMASITSVGMLLKGFNQTKEGIKVLKENLILLAAQHTAEGLAAEAAAVAQAKAAGATQVEALSAGKAALAEHAHGMALKEVASSLLLTYGYLIPVVAILGALGLAIYGAYKEWNKEADAAKKASEVAADTKKTYDDLKASLQDIKSALEDLHSAEDNLDGLTKGTQEWRDALQQCNDKMLELISNYPELAQYVTNENGQLKLNADGEQAYLDQLQAGVQNARNASYIASSNSREADINAAAADIGHNSTYGFNTAGQSGGYVSAEQVKTVVQAIDKVIGEGADLKGGLSGLTDKIVDQTGQSKELVSAILSNEDAVLQLRTQLQQNETADKLMYETMAQGALANNSTFKGMDELGQQVASAIGGADLESKVQQIKADLMKTMTDGVAVWSGSSNQQVKDILKRLNDAQGTNWKLDSNAVRGTDGNRTFAFLDQAGQLHTYTKQQIASTIAAKQALQDLGASAETASKVLANIDTKVSGNAQNAVKQWIAGQDVTDINKSGLQELPKDLAQLFNEDELKSLAEARGIDTQNNKEWQEQLEKDWDNSLQDLSSSFDNVTKDASATVRAAFNSIKDDETIKQATLGTQQEIVAQMQQTFTKGGSKALGQLTEFYSELKDTDSKDGLSALDAFSKATKDFDFNTGNVEDFKQALKEAGVETTASTQAIQAYINAQKQASGLSPEQNYKSVHDITDKLKKGDTIDAEQAATLEAAGVNVKEFFKLTADGSYELKTKAETFQQYINGITIEPFKARMDQLQEKINSIHAFDQGGDFAQFSSQNMDIDEFSSNAGSLKHVGQGAWEVQSQNTDKLKAQIQYLKIVGVEDAAIRQTEKDIDAGRNTSVQNLQKISALVRQNAQYYDNLSEKEKQYLEEMSQRESQIADASNRGLDSDVDETKWENLSEHLQKYADQIDEVSDQLKDNAEVADDVAQAMLRYDSAIGQVQKNYNDWLQALTSGSIEDQVQATEDLENVYSDLLDLPFDNILSADFLQNVDNLNLLKQAANGSEQAYNQLAEAAAQDIAINAGMDTSDFEAGKDLIQSYTQDGVAFDDIEVGAFLDDTNFIQGLNEMINATDMGVQQATDLLASMGVDAQVEAIKVPEQDKQQFINATPNVAYEDVAAPISVLDGLGNVTWDESNTVKVPRINYDLKPTNETADKESTATVLRVKSARKASGGGFKYKNSSAGNRGGGSGKGGGGKKGGGKKGGGGGSGKAKEPNKAKGATNKADRYRNNTVKANKLANQMTKLNKQQERLTGKDSLKNLQKQLEILEKQKDVIRERLGLQRDEQNELANNLKKYGATFDKDGTLNNYFATHDKILKEYNNKVARWNQMTAEQQENNKDYLNNAKEIMDQAFKDLERYDKLQQEIAKTQQEQIDKVQEQIDLKVKQLDLKIKAELDLSEAKRDWNKFQRDIVNEIRDDDILGLNRFRFADLASYYNEAGTGSIQNLTDRLKEVMGDQNGIFSGSYFTQQLANMSITDRAAQLEKVKEIFDDLQDQMEGFKEIADEIKESIFDAIDAAQDAFDEQMDEYEYLGDLIDHNMKITEMFFGDEAYDQMAKFYDRIEENNNAQLDFLAKQKDLWYSRMAEEQARMNQLAQTQGTDSNLYKEARDRFEEYKKHWMDTVKDLNSTVEDALDNIMDKYNNAINKILVNFELKLGDGHTLDDIEDEWDILNDQADRYFDKINAAYEIDKLENAFNDAINDNDGDIAAQQSLNDLMEQQLAYLRDKQRLTQYDVDRANALLQIEMKRLALEQSRSNKNRLRLRRDSQGNYTYQYTADTEAISKAEQELADAQNSLYNSDKAAYVDNLSDIQKSAENIKNKLEDIWTDENLSKEQKLQKSYELEKYYGDQINKLLEDNANIRNNLIQSSTEELAKIYGINIEQFQSLTDQEQTNILKDLIPQAGSYLSKMTEGLIGDGGIGKLFEDSINRFLQAEDERINSIAEIERNGQINFEDIISDTNTVIGQAEQLLDNNQALINSYEQELNAVQNTINGVNDLIQTYERAKQAAIQAATAANDFINQENVELIGSSLSREAAAQRANDNVLNSWIVNGNSYGDLQNYTPYEPNWHSSDFAAIFGSSNVGLADLAAYQEALQNTGSTTGNIIGQSEYTPININSILDTIQSNVSHINDILEALHTESSNYYTNALNKAKDIERAIIANQTVHIDADFPNARDVSNIIDAINNLTLVAAQKAGKI